MTDEISAEKPQVNGVRVSGKQWKVAKEPLRVRAIGLKKSAWEKKKEKADAVKLAKLKEKQMKDEKEQARKEKIDMLKAKREAKAEKERYELLAQKMHAKKVERIRRREKRNKLLADGR